MTQEQLNDWLQRTGWSKSEAATHLGISRRMFYHYLDGSWPVPKTVALACLALEAGIRI